MRAIEWTSAFKRDYKRTMATPRHRDVAILLETVGDSLATDETLPAKYRDHSFTG